MPVYVLYFVRTINMSLIWNLSEIALLRGSENASSGHLKRR